MTLRTIVAAAILAGTARTAASLAPSRPQASMRLLQPLLDNAKVKAALNTITFAEQKHITAALAVRQGK